MLPTNPPKAVRSESQRLAYDEGEEVKVRVDESKCRSHYVCNLIAPSVFVVDDDSDIPAVPPGEVAAENVEAVERAALSCPERAIVVE